MHGIVPNSGSSSEVRLHHMVNLKFALPKFDFQNRSNLTRLPFQSPKWSPRAHPCLIFHPNGKKYLIGSLLCDLTVLLNPCGAYQRSKVTFSNILQLGY